MTTSIKVPVRFQSAPLAGSTIKCSVRPVNRPESVAVGTVVNSYELGPVGADMWILVMLPVMVLSGLIVNEMASTHASPKMLLLE